MPRQRQAAPQGRADPWKVLASLPVREKPVGTPTSVIWGGNGRGKAGSLEEVMLLTPGLAARLTQCLGW